MKRLFGSEEPIPGVPEPGNDVTMLIQVIVKRSDEDINVGMLLLDPMLATGGSASAAISFIKKRGCTHIRLVNLIAAPEGIARIQKEHPDVDIFVAALHHVR